MLKIVSASRISATTWDNFCLNSPTAWFRHTSKFLRYTTEISFEKKINDISFAVLKEDELAAVVPLIFQPINGHSELFEFAMGDTPIPYPAFRVATFSEASQVFKVIFQEIDRLAKEFHLASARFFIDPLSDSILTCHQRYNPFMKFGCHITDTTTNVIVLKDNEQNILNKMARGHRTDIIFAAKQEYVVEIFDTLNITREIFSIYQNLHLRAAGRKTRPDESWESMFNWIRGGNALLSLIRKQGGKVYLSGILVITYKNKSYYGSGATDPEHEKIRGLGHLLQWETIKYMIKHGITHYEIGWNAYPIISEDVASPKEINIAHFKSLFGGDVIPLFRAEKYYDREYLKAKREELTEKFIQLYP